MNDIRAILSLVGYKVLPKLEGISSPLFLASCKSMQRLVTPKLSSSLLNFFYCFNALDLKIKTIFERKILYKIYVKIFARYLAPFLFSFEEHTLILKKNLRKNPRVLPLLVCF